MILAIQLILFSAYYWVEGCKYLSEFGIVKFVHFLCFMLQIFKASSYSFFFFTRHGILLLLLISVDITHMHSSMIAEHPWLQNAKKAPNVPLRDIVKSRLKASLHSSMID
jgi:hypothetical protein